MEDSNKVTTEDTESTEGTECTEVTASIEVTESTEKIKVREDYGDKRKDEGEKKN